MKRINEHSSKIEVYFSVLDYGILVPVITVSIIGLYVLFNVLSSGYDGNGPSMFLKQSGAVFFGMMIALMIGALEPPVIRLISYSVYGISILLLLVVLLDRFDMVLEWGADRWMKLPFIGTFQPSELAKVGIILISSYILADIKTRRISWLRGGFFLLGVYALPIMLILRQPDLGAVLVIVAIIACMLFVTGIKYRYILLSASLGIASVPLAWSFFLAPYQKNRILTFLYPGFNPDHSFNIEQAKSAIMAGGLIGNRAGETIYVPVKESDFIYTAVAEQLGLAGTSVLIALLFFFIVRSFHLAAQSPEPSSAFMVAGLAAMFGIHTIQNLGMCVGLMPITGIPLPFVSLGGSSMMVNFFALGIILCISIDRNISVKMRSYEFDPN